MTDVDIVVESPVSGSTRARQLEATFDVPRVESSRIEWHGSIDLEQHPWNVGLIVGPSGSGKSTLMRHLFGEQQPLAWAGASVVDDFDPDLTMQQITDACQAVGFNTIPAWLRPYDVLSTGEKFRVDLARRLAETPALVVVDEFSSVVDRQVAQIGSYAVQKFARRGEHQFVAVTCHYDVVEWLQPDWVIEMPTLDVEWRSVQPRPPVDVTVAPVPYSYWRLFAPFHYLTAELNRSARCFCLFVGEQPAAFAGVLHRPHAKTRNIKGVSRLVTLPDWQGLGLAFALVDALGAAHKAIDLRLRTYPAHPALIRGFDRSSRWAMVAKPAQFGNKIGIGRTSGFRPGGGENAGDTIEWHQGSRPCAVFEYAGAPADDVDASRRLLTATTR